MANADYSDRVNSQQAGLNRSWTSKSECSGARQSGGANQRAARPQAIGQMRRSKPPLTCHWRAMNHGEGQTLRHKLGPLRDLRRRPDGDYNTPQGKVALYQLSYALVLGRKG